MTLRIERKWWVLVAIGTGSFMAALDGSVVNTVLPVIQQSFQSQVAAIEWVVTVYLLVLSGLLLTFGRLGDLRGHKSVYIWGFGIFVLGSALCGAAVSIEMLVASRALQAVGAAMLASNAPAILTGNFPGKQRGQALGMQATMTYLGLTVGPSLGGWLANSLGWRSIFYINLPVGALALTLGLIFIPRQPPAEAHQSFDLAGAFTFLTGLVSLLLALNKGAEWGWSSPLILLLFLAAGTFLITFITIERHTTAPMLDLSLFRHPLFSASVANAILNYICLYTITFLLPFYLIQGRGLNPAQAGLLLTAQPILMAITAPISGTLSDRIGSRLPGMVGMAILSLGLILLSRLESTTPLWHVALGLTIAGIGTGIFISPNNSALMGSAPRARQGIAAGVLAASRNVGMVLGVGLAGALLTSRLNHAIPATLFEGISAGLLTAAGIALLGVVIAATKEKGS